MNNQKCIVLTVFGHDRKIDKISVSLFSDTFRAHNADTYCNMINKLELIDNAWVFAQVISENTPYTLDFFLPHKFSELILKLDDIAIQKVLREGTYHFTKALKGEKEHVQSKVFQNMTKRAAQMLKDDMECLGQIGFDEIKKAQDEIISIILTLIDCGEILSPY